MEGKEGKEDDRKRPQRHLTQRYDMHALHAIQAVEERLQAALGEIYKCDPDELPVDIDTLKIFNADAAERRSMIEGVLRGAPADTSVCVNAYLVELQGLDDEGAKPVLTHK